MFGEVTVSIFENPQAEKMFFSEKVFDWMGEDSRHWPITNENKIIRGARKGIEHCWKNIPVEISNRKISFKVEQIRFTEVDSTEDTIAYAACFAAWQALGLKPVSPPTIEGNQILFA